VFTGKNIRVRGAEAAEHQGEILYFSGDKLHWVKNGRLIQSYDASSGQFGPPYKGLAFTETWKNSGPIPPGLYQFEPKEISQPSDPVKWVYRKYISDWGDYRVPLKPLPGTETLGRGGHYIHGGRKQGSAGCIDIGENDKRLFPYMKKSQGPVLVVVGDYSDFYDF
jgi:hypothetical protein